jgi:hypothetical protein
MKNEAEEGEEEEEDHTQVSPNKHEQSKLQIQLDGLEG